MCYLTILSVPEQCRNRPSPQDSGREMCAIMRMSHLVKFTFYMSDFDKNWNGMIVYHKILPYQIHEDLFSRSVNCYPICSKQTGGRAELFCYALRKDVNALGNEVYAI